MPDDEVEDNTTGDSEMELDPDTKPDYEIHDNIRDKTRAVIPEPDPDPDPDPEPNNDNDEIHEEIRENSDGENSEVSLILIHLNYLSS